MTSAKRVRPDSEPGRDNPKAGGLQTDFIRFPVAVSQHDGEASKHPLTNGQDWRHYHAAESELSACANRGVVIPRGILAVDVDSYKNPAARDAIEHALGCPLPWDAALLQTTVRGGQHYGFRVPPDADMKQGSCVLGVAGFDTRCAGRGWLATGEGYTPPPTGETLEQRLCDALPALPAAALAKLTKPSRPEPAPAFLRATGPAQVDVGRHDDVVKLTANLARLGVSRDSALALMQAERARGRWSRDVPDDEIERAFGGAADKFATGQWPAPVPEVPAGELRLVPLGDLSQASKPPVECVMYPYFPKRQVTLFGGHGDAGKTYLALALAAHIATGTPWAGHVTVRGRVLFVSLEDEPEFLRWRLARVCDAYTLDMATVSEGVTIADGTATAATLAVEVGNGKQLAYSHAFDDLRRLADGFDCVMVDNASDAFQANSNDAALVRPFMRALQGVAREVNAAAVLLAHVSKSSAQHGAAGNSYIGSTAWHNTARSRIALAVEDGTSRLLHEKHNLTEGADPVILSRNGVGVPLPVSEAALRQDENAAATLQAQEDAPGVLEVLRAAIDGGQDISPTRSGNYSAFHVLRNFGLAGYDGRAGKARFWRAMDVLYADGRLTHEDYRNGQRKLRKRIVIAEKCASGDGGAEPASTGATPSNAGSARAPVPHTP